MAVCKMQRMNIFALQEDRDRVLECLQSHGAMEINIPELSEELTTADTQNERQSCERQVQLLQQALDLLDRYAPEKKSMLAGLAGKPVMNRQDYAAVCDRGDSILGQARTVLSLDKDAAEHHAAITRLENQIESLQPWQSLDIPMSFSGTKDTVLLLGTLPGVFSQTAVLDALAAADAELPVPDLTLISQSKDYAYIAVLALRADAQRIEEALRGIGFARPSQCVDEIPRKAQERLKAEITEHQTAITGLEAQLAKLGSCRSDFAVLSDAYRLRAGKYEVSGKLPQSKKTFLVSGYVPEEVSAALKKELEETCGAAAEIEELPEEEEAPVLLKNGRFGGITEDIVKSFGLPGKGEFDPTFLTSIFYVFFFGLMLSDAAYGLILSLACGIVLLKFPRMASGTKRMMQLFFWGGLSTLFWGVMFGGYFGDIVQVVSRTFFGHEVKIPPVWFEPLADPTRLLIYSLLFGLIHLFAGLGCKGYLCLKHKDVVGFIFDVLCWYFLLIGLIVMLLPTDLFYSISQMEFNFSAGVVTGGKVLAIVGAVGILLMSARDKKNPLLRVALGAYDLYNITGWLSDVLSYSRLLALGLATGVIAQVINQMGSMFGTSIVGIILFAIVFVAGSVLNIAINLLGAYVHTTRLQYVEFYGKFYEGGGREFTPFKQTTSYIDIKEEH